ncbi:MAG TPA: type IX secretion system protein PorQ [Bacteroidia bacterium]|nr:type IX secretion system protein PorQ [Bacteroidia bacterium]
MRKIVLFCLLILSVGKSFSQVGGLASYSYLNLPIPARTAALGGSSIALKDDDINTAVQNPASLSSKTNNALSGSYINFLGAINYGYLTYGRSFKKIGHFAVGIQDIGYGSISERDEYGNQVGTFKANDYNFNLTYTYDKDSLLSYGATLKTIYSKYSQYTSIGNALDFGITYNKASKLFVLSAVIQNVGKEWKTYTGGPNEKLPFNILLGASKKFKHAPFRFIVTYDYLNRWDLTYTDPNNPPPTVDPFTKEPIKQHPLKKFMDKAGRHFILATEISLTKTFFIRVGFNYKMRKELSLTDKQGIAGFSGGIGFKISKFNFSYSYAQISPVYSMNSLTLSTNLSSFVKIDKPIVTP